MADLRIDFAGIKSPNPFWLASAPPANSGAQVHKAFEAGWGGAVWKTIGAPGPERLEPIRRVDYGGQRMLAINNVELISDRPLEVNLREIAEVKRAWPDRAVIVSAMVESKPEVWHDIIRRIEDTGADGVELNYGCPHGMSERGMGAAVGQVPEYCEQITRWVMDVARIPVIVKLTPNVTSIVGPARAAVAAGATGLSLINTLNSIIGVDLDTSRSPQHRRQRRPRRIRGPGCQANRAEHAFRAGRRRSGFALGAAGVGYGWNHHLAGCRRILAARARSLQVCTAVMHYGFRIIEDLCDGLSNWMDSKVSAPLMRWWARACIASPISRTSICPSAPLPESITDKCIKCNLCYVACNDTAHQCIDLIDRSGGVVQPYSYSVTFERQDMRR